MRVHFAHLVFVAWSLVASKCAAADDLSACYYSLRTVVIKYYPAATFPTKDKTVTFEHDTRLFSIHEPLKTGEWQDAREQRGPKRGGIYCEIISGTGT